MNVQQGTLMETVVLLHGIWMKPVIMRPLAARLRTAGFNTCCFSYPSVKKTPAQNARLLHEYTDSLPGDRLHFVAHSLGGIVLMHYFARFQEPRPGRVVLLGSPLRGSAYAEKFHQLSLVRRALGNSTEQGLLGDVPAWQGGRDLGMVAGTRNIGVGNLLGRAEQTNDGAVFLSETQLPGLTDHISLPVSHTGMLLSARVARQVIHFLKNGCFLIDR
jgi:pimeloyl-ACP methyl ester carboxylesterase